MSDITIIEGASDADIAAWIAVHLATALDDGAGCVTISVPGGSTPFPIIAKLVRQPLAWKRVTVWPSDDRQVPEAHPASNTGRLKALFAPVGAEVVSLDTLDPVVAAAPRFAVAWLGMGADGHVASLFPGNDPRSDDPRSVRRLSPRPLPPDAPYDRISLTLPALLNSNRIVLVIRGAEKRAIFDEARAGRSDLPVARLLAAARQPVTCFT